MSLLARLLQSVIISGVCKCLILLTELLVKMLDEFSRTLRNSFYASANNRQRGIVFSGHLDVRPLSVQLLMLVPHDAISFYLVQEFH